MNKRYERALLLRDSADVKRFHVMRTLRTQTVGAHAYGVASLVSLVQPNCSANLLKAALFHDAHERATGDMPSTAKWAYPELREAAKSAEAKWNRLNGFEFDAVLTEHELNILDWCDYLELLMWANEEFRLGNTYAWEPIANIVRVMDDMAAPTPEAREIYLGARDAIPIEELNRAARK